LSYVIAAYGLVFALLLGYGLRVQAQRRARLRHPPLPARPRER
jgi:uncharacterized membrane protein YeiB